MSRTFTSVALVALLLAATVFLSRATASASTPPEPAQPALLPGDYGDAPEGGVAYSPPGTPGLLSTCIVPGPSLWIEHGLMTAWFGPSVDPEMDGNQGLCQPGPCFPAYDADECFADGDAGLIAPGPYTIDPSLNVVPCAQSPGTPLGNVCQSAAWASNVDILVTNNIPTGAMGFVNLLIDWNQDGQWGGTAPCPGGVASEHVLVDFPVPSGYAGPLSALQPPPFLIGPNSGCSWARFSITDRPVGMTPWSGDGIFEDGETEDYLLLINNPQAEEYDWGDAPDSATTPRYLTLSVNGGARHLMQTGYMLGQAVDADIDGQPGANAAGDDSDSDGDDEDGITFANPLMMGQQACVDVHLTNTTPQVARLYGWIDFDRNGAWDDAPESSERVFSGTFMTPGLNAGLCFTVPPTATPGRTYARFRLSSSGGVAPAGWAGDGEVEDYPVVVEAVKWAQPPYLSEQSPHPECYWGWDELSVFEGRQIAADDWLCRDDRPVTDIHWWGSYEGWDKEGPPSVAPKGFHIGIWTDTPAGTSFSHPAVLVWESVARREDVHERLAGCDFFPGAMNDPDSCFEYHLVLPEDEWFYQKPDGERVYWLSISAIYGDPPPDEFAWGWKTRPRFFNDDAVRIFVPDAPELGDRYEQGEPIKEGWDLAFVLTTPPYDLGDAPNSYGTTFAAGGAAHQQTGAGPFMGAAVDTDPDGQPTAQAAGDDTDADGDDEDGVQLTAALIPGQPAAVTVDMTASAAGCILSAWLDTNKDGVWADPAERIITDVPLPPGLLTTLNFSLPALPPSPPTGYTLARFRCSSVAGLLPWGVAPDGEVEDYYWEIMAPPAAPDAAIAIVNTVDVRLSWPRVDLDIYGNAITVEGYRIFRATTPYALLPWTNSVWSASFPAVVTWDDLSKVGDPSVNYYYRVTAVRRDAFTNEVSSDRSNEVGEFDYGLTPGSP